MNCQEFCEELAAYLEKLLDAERQNRIESHLAECPACRAELEAVRALSVRLARHGLAAPPVSLETAVMDRILHQQAREIRRLKMRRRIRVFGVSGALASALAILFVVGLWFTPSAEAQKAAEIMTKGAEAVAHSSAMHIVARMRTPPKDNFSAIDAKCDFVPVEIWRQLGEKPKWRVEKPGRVAVMDGASTTMFIRPDWAMKFPHASDGAFDTGWMLGLANTHDMIIKELRNARILRWNLNVVETATAADEEKLLVTVEVKTWLPDNDYVKNCFFDLSDMRRVYRFDAKTQRLEGLDAYLHQADGDVLVWTIERIEYDQPIDPTVFALELPENVRWAKEPTPLPDNEKYEKMTPEQAARAYFEACSREDWDEVDKFDYAPIGQESKEYLGGLQLLSLGTPFRSLISIVNGDWFVPYEIKLKDGTMKKWNLALRPDKQAKRFIIDGGL